MKLGIIGASGRTGLAIIEAATRAGHETIAIVRDPSRVMVPVTEIRTADALSGPQLAKAFAGLDALTWAVGPGRDAEDGVMTASITATIAALGITGVRRLVAVTASGPYTEGDNWITRAIVKPILWRSLGGTWRDMQATEIAIRASDTDWTILRPPQLKDGQAKGKYRSRRDLNVRGRFTITRADLGQSFIDVLGDDETIHHSISVAN